MFLQFSLFCVRFVASFHFESFLFKLLLLLTLVFLLTIRSNSLGPLDHKHTYFHWVRPQALGLKLCRIAEIYHEYECDKKSKMVKDEMKVKLYLDMVGEKVIFWLLLGIVELDHHNLR